MYVVTHIHGSSGTLAGFPLIRSISRSSIQIVETLYQGNRIDFVCAGVNRSLDRLHVFRRSVRFDPGRAGR